MYQKVNSLDLAEIYSYIHKITSSKEYTLSPANQYIKMHKINPI